MYGANIIEYTKSDEKYFINIIIYHAFNLLKDLFKILIKNLDLLQVKKQTSIFIKTQASMLLLICMKLCKILSYLFTVSLFV